MDISNLLNKNYEHHQREYAFFLSYASFVSSIFFLGIYLPLSSTAYLSLLAGGLIAWLFLTAVSKIGLWNRAHDLLRRFAALLSLLYGGFTLYAFFRFCQSYIFPDHGFLFFPVCFVLLTAYGALQGVYVLERTAKFTSVTVMILLFLTLISTVQKLWAQREFLRLSLHDLPLLPGDDFLRQTIWITVVLLCQAMILLLTVDHLYDPVPLLRSIRRGMVWGTLCSSLLHLLAAAALGAYSFRRLTYPVYDMLSLPGYAEYLDRTEFLMLIIFLFCESTKTISILLAGKKMFPIKKIHTSS